MELYRAGEDYLKAIYILRLEKDDVHSMDVVKRLGISKASVSRALRLLREGGFITMDDDKLLYLTKVGCEIAEQVYEKYRILTAWLVAMGVDPETAEKDACRMEHVVSEKSVEILKARIEEKAMDPGMTGPTAE